MSNEADYKAAKIEVAMQQLGMGDSLHKLGADAIEAVLAAQKEDTTMTDKPERTWIDWPNPNSAGLAFSCQARTPARRTEYVRGDLVDALEARVEKLEKVLKWYEEQATLCRLVHALGDTGRHALADDGGKRARTALET